MDAGRPDGRVVGVDGGEVRFTGAANDAAEGLVEISLALPAALRAGREQLDLAGVRFSLSDAEA